MKRKKSTAKKVSKPKHHESVEVLLMREVYGKPPEEYHFVLSNGQRLKNLKELVESIDFMSDEIFMYHVNESKNDFSRWIKDIFKDELLADELMKFPTKLEAKIILQKHINKKMEKLIRKLAK